MKLRRYNKFEHEVIDIIGPVSDADALVIGELFSAQRQIKTSEKAYEQLYAQKIQDDAHKPVVFIKAKHYRVIFRRIFVIHETIIRQLLYLQHEFDLKITTDEIYLSAYLNKLGLKILYERSNALFCRLKHLSQTKIIALTGSADSSEKIHEILRELPYCESLSICIVQHISHDAQLIYDKVLQDLTHYKVQYAEQGMKVTGGNVYIAQPDHHLRIKNGLFELTQDKAVSFARPSIDVTLTSLAEEYGSSAVGVVLCGYSIDGVAGAQYAVNKNMPLIIEEEKECAAHELIKHIKESGHYHLEVAMPKLICMLSIFSSSEKHLFEHYFNCIYSQYGYDFRNYVLESVKRRIDAAIHKYQCRSQRQFLISTLNYKRKFKRLLMELSISTSYFFREPSSWCFIRDMIISQWSTQNHIKIWSAGSSTGKEAYSMAMLAEQTGILKKCLIYATDMNKNSLLIARNALYPLDEINLFEENFKAGGGHGDIQRYVNKEAHFFSIAPRLRETVFFFRHNLATEACMNTFDLIFFNNVQIYFNQFLRDSVLELLKNSLTIGGYLIIGENENISGLQQERYFKAVNTNIFQRIN